VTVGPPRCWHLPHQASSAGWSRRCGTRRRHSARPPRVELRAVTLLAKRAADQHSTGTDGRLNGDESSACHHPGLEASGERRAGWRGIASIRLRSCLIRSTSPPTSAGETALRLALLGRVLRQRPQWARCCHHEASVAPSVPLTNHGMSSALLDARRCRARGCELSWASSASSWRRRGDGGARGDPGLHRVDRAIDDARDLP
jgi:hypothetical protein